MSDSEHQHDIRAVFDADGLNPAFYDATVDPPERIPADAVEISQEDWHAFLAGGKRWDGTGLVDYAPPAPPAPVTVVAKVDIYRQLSDADYDRMQAKVGEQPARVQGIFNAAINFRSDAPEWQLLNAMATELFGAERAAKLLTPASS